MKVKSIFMAGLVAMSSSYASELSLESILDLSVGSLVKTNKRDNPSSLTTISREMIEKSSARRLDELLEIYVPSVQFIRHNFGQNHMGVRGIISDRDNKWLLLVNGRLMNERTQNGAMTERDLPTLMDIKKVDVIRGPGASTYGPGAVSGVVAITTFKGSEVEGLTLQAQAGAVEEFGSLEFRYGKKVKDDESFMLYYGVTDYNGSDSKNSPIISGQDVSDPNVDVDAGDEVKPGINKFPNDRQAYRDNLKHKAHLQWNKGTTEVWARVTSGGENSEARRGSGAADFAWNANFAGNNIQTGFFQSTVYAKHVHSFSEKFKATFALSFDGTEWATFRRASNVDGKQQHRTYREEEIYARALGVWDISDKDSFAFGVEYSRENFGLPAKFLSGAKARAQFDNGSTSGVNDLDDDAGWVTNTISPMLEYKKEFSDKYTLIASARGDKHTYTDFLVSPRLVQSYKPNDRDTYKVILNRSLRRNDDHQLRLAENLGKKGEVEAVTSYELKYDREIDKKSMFKTTLYYNSGELLAWNTSLERTLLIGEYSNAGLEFEFEKKTDTSRFGASHTIHQLLDFNQGADGNGQDYTASSYSNQQIGSSSQRYSKFDKRVTVWSDHETKLQYYTDLTDKLTFDTSAIILWSLDGAKDWGDKNRQDCEAEAKNCDLASKEGYDEMANMSFYLNFGTTYEYSQNLKLRLNLHNVLGWADKSFNKRNFIKRTAEYRSLAPSVSGALTYNF